MRDDKPNKGGAARLLAKEILSLDLPEQGGQQELGELHGVDFFGAAARNPDKCLRQCLKRPPRNSSSCSIFDFLQLWSAAIPCPKQDRG